MATKNQILSSIIGYGIQNNKSKKDVLKAIVQSGQFDPFTANTALKQFDDSVLGSGDDSPQERQNSIDNTAKEKLGTGVLLQQYYTNRNIYDKIAQYKKIYEDATTDNTMLPTEMSGVKAAQLKGMYNDIIFQIAQAEGTGALQAADKAVVKDMLPDVSTLNPLEAGGQMIRGGKEGNLAAMDTLLQSAKERIERLSGQKMPESEFIGGIQTQPNMGQPVEQNVMQTGGMQQNMQPNVQQKPMPTVEGALEWARKNPNKPNAKRIMEANTDGTLKFIIDQKAGASQQQVGVQGTTQPTNMVNQEKPNQTQISNSRVEVVKDLVNQGITNPKEIKSILDEQTQAQGMGNSDFTTDEIKSYIQETPQVQEKTTTEKIGNTLGDIFGGKTWGEAIGNVIGSYLAKNGEAGKIFQQNIANIEDAFKEGRLTQEQRDRLIDETEKTAKEAFGYDGPSMKQLAGDTAYIAMNFIPMAKAAKGATMGTKLATAGMNIGKAAVTGAAKAASENKDMQKGATNSALFYGGATALGKLLGVAGGIGKRASASFSGLGTDVIDEIIKNPKAGIKGMRGDSSEIIKKSAKESVKTLDKFITQYQDEYSGAMKNLGKIDVDHEKIKTGLLDDVMTALKSRGVVETKKGLDFSKSRFIEASDEKRISLALQEIKNLKDFGPESLNLAKQRVSELVKSSSDDNKIINSALGEITKSIRKQMDGMGSEISSINKKYSEKLDLANTVKKELGGIKNVKNIGRQDLINIEKRLGTLFTRNKESVRNVLKDIGLSDVVGQQAGAEIDRVESGQSAKIGEALMNVVRSIGTPRVVGEIAAKKGQLEQIVNKITGGNSEQLSDVERRLLSRVMSILGNKTNIEQE